ncbi:transcriptional regulator family: C2H2 zinc finger [Penicillium viridicatum]|nr:transcriptional regulator family: C2H2 zinc finger [Penicillium viridicatum]
MVRAFSDEHSDAFPFEGETLPHTSALVQNTPRSTLPYLEQNPPFSSSIYDPYMQSPWALDGFGLSIPATFPQIGMDPITGWVRENPSPAGAENTINSYRIDFGRSGSSDHQQGQISTPVGVPSKGATCEVSPSDDRTSRRRRSRPNAK